MPRKPTRAIDFSEVPEASADQLGALRRLTMRRSTPASSAPIPADSADGQSLRSDEAGPSERDMREGIQRGLANAKAGRTTPAQRVFGASLPHEGLGGCCAGRRDRTEEHEKSCEPEHAVLLTVSEGEFLTGR
jgi:hypothetical protein